MTANDLMAAIMTDDLDGLTLGQHREFADRVADVAPELYDAVLAGMRGAGILD